MIPILLVLMSALSLWRYWPVTLIATGLEELYLWSTSKNAS